MDEKRFNELYSRAFNKNINTFSEFLNLDEQSILALSYLECAKFGGYASAERVVAGFGDNVQNDDFPISIIKISPLNQKFADKLGHRDFLGSLMNLGIKRELLGDILIKDNVGYLFCLDQIRDYIISELTRIKHTSVKLECVDELPSGIVSEGEVCEVFVASLRLDAIISSVYKLSRSESAKLFQQEKVFVNSKATTNTSYQVKPDDIISVRGYGRLEFIDQIKQTKKNRLVIEIKKY